MAVSGGVSNVLIVHPDNPAKTVADVLAQARAKPGELTFSSGGVGTSHHMSGVLLEMRTGVKLQHVPYRATPAGIQAVANGEVAMGLFNTPTVIGLIKGGKLKAIAVTSEKRSDLLPEVPTMIESGVKDYVVNTWMGFAAPAGVPGAGRRQAQCRDQPHRPVAADPREDAGPGHRDAAAGVAGRRPRSWCATTWRCGCPSSRPRGRRRISRPSYRDAASCLSPHRGRG